MLEISKLDFLGNRYVFRVTGPADQIRELEGVHGVRHDGRGNFFMRPGISYQAALDCYDAVCEKWLWVSITGAKQS